MTLDLFDVNLNIKAILGCKPCILLSNLGLIYIHMYWTLVAVETHRHSEPSRSGVPSG